MGAAHPGRVAVTTYADPPLWPIHAATVDSPESLGTPVIVREILSTVRGPVEVEPLSMYAASAEGLASPF